MINFLAGFVAGSVCACIVLFYVRHGNESDGVEKPEEERLKKVKEERAKRLKELERQFDNMMNYKGEEQR